MIIEVTPKYPPYGKTELNIDRIIAMSPEECRIYFEYVYWNLHRDDYQKVAEAWRNKFRD